MQKAPPFMVWNRSTIWMCWKKLIWIVQTKIFMICIILPLNWRGSVSVQQTLCHSTIMVCPGAPCPGRRHHLCLERVLRLAGRAHHHQPEDHLQAGRPAWLSLGDHLQGRAELASCEGGVGRWGRRVFFTRTNLIWVFLPISFGRFLPISFGRFFLPISFGRFFYQSHLEGEVDEWAKGRRGKRSPSGSDYCQLVFHRTCDQVFFIKI